TPSHPWKMKRSVRCLSASAKATASTKNKGLQRRPFSYPHFVGKHLPLDVITQARFKQILPWIANADGFDVHLDLSAALEAVRKHFSAALNDCCQNRISSFLSDLCLIGANRYLQILQNLAGGALIGPSIIVGCWDLD